LNRIRLRATDYGLCDGVTLRVGKADHDFPHAARAGGFGGASMQGDAGPTGWFVEDFDVGKGHRVADAGAERFGDCLFGGKPRRKPFGAPGTSGYLIFRKNTVKKLIAMLFQNVGDAGYLDQIHADTEEFHDAEGGG